MEAILAFRVFTLDLRGENVTQLFAKSSQKYAAFTVRTARICSFAPVLGKVGLRQPTGVKHPVESNCARTAKIISSARFDAFLKNMEKRISRFLIFCSLKSPDPEKSGWKNIKKYSQGIFRSECRRLEISSLFSHFCYFFNPTFLDQETSDYKKLKIQKYVFPYF